jgi:uncharacterized membrane protein YdfJ with MMPL/SSD domain
MTIGVHCGSCDRELLLVQLAQPSQGFRCLFCGFAFAPGYATIAPGIAAQMMVAHAALVTALTELASMTGDRLRLEGATVVGPVANALPQVEADAEQPAPTRRRHTHRWPRLVALPRTTLTPRPQR